MHLLGQDKDFLVLEAVVFPAVLEFLFDLAAYFYSVVVGEVAGVEEFVEVGAQE
jgi:hypothetical protein